ncbi:Calcineurin-like phosphoesterase [Carpediemonas membranifera]|uniref:Calcineurin-like phosphoesterase n=1 Tax=Carpediemonas membranifera TaxID=201153 RepID=A0A8J6BB36_9EUKA|nr:Calcineurin-like phosphoesterase [Carpediemonas membranifera]|eukprot:KAG9393657.1 Calcineurin-like phosphoesterase [Carpediemonas membranifera]
MRIAVIGDVHGEYSKAYDHVAKLEKEDGKPIDLVIMCGDLKTMRDEGDLDTLQAPEKYRKTNDFVDYYWGKKTAPYFTICISGNHDSMNHITALPYGGWLAPKMYYLGRSACVTYKGLRIAGLSGIFKPYSIDLPLPGHAPFDESDLISSYHQRTVDMEKLAGLDPVDISLSHDWPARILMTPGADTRKIRSNLVKEDRIGHFGSQFAAQMIKDLSPAYHFSGHLHHEWSVKTGSTQFMALAQADKKNDAEFVKVIDIEPRGGAKDTGLELDGKFVANLTNGHHSEAYVVPTNTFTRKPKADTRAVEYFEEPHTKRVATALGLPLPTHKSKVDAASDKRAKVQESTTKQTTEPLEGLDRCGMLIQLGRGLSARVVAAMAEQFKAKGLAVASFSYDEFCFNPANQNIPSDRRDDTFTRGIIEAAWSADVVLIDHPVPDADRVNAYREIFRSLGTRLIVLRATHPVSLLPAAVFSCTRTEYRSKVLDGLSEPNVARHVASEVAVMDAITALELPIDGHDSAERRAELGKVMEALSTGEEGIGDGPRLAKLLEANADTPAEPADLASLIIARALPDPVVARLVKLRPFAPEAWREHHLWPITANILLRTKIVKMTICPAALRHVVGFNGTTTRRINRRTGCTVTFRQLGRTDSKVVLRIDGTDADKIEDAVTMIERAIHGSKPTDDFTHDVMIVHGLTSTRLGSLRLYTDHQESLAMDALKGVKAILGGATELKAGDLRMRVNNLLFKKSIGFVASSGDFDSEERVKPAAVVLRGSRDYHMTVRFDLQ